jgi:hypothetical protein
MVYSDVDSDARYSIGEPVAAATTDATTGFFSVNLALTSGINTIRAATIPTTSMTDAVGSSPFTVNVRPVATSAPGSVSLLAASDTTLFNAVSGISGGSFVTADNRPQLRLSLPREMQQGDLIQLFNGATKIYSVMPTAAAITAGFSDVRLPMGGELAEGSHSLTTKVFDAAGNTSQSSTITRITIDTTGPMAPTNLGLAPGSDTGGLNKARIQ